ncbi:MAG: AAA family ATPase, partial [Fibrobacter sp.]|nr:AAA family ATPase [Fibrobacter sp.]
MGTYINIGNAGFQSARNGEYVDKSMLISVVNKTLFTERRFSCVSRCRRFGKSMAAKMLYAYYDHSCDSRALFADLAIAADPTFEQHLNKYA